MKRDNGARGTRALKLLNEADQLEAKRPTYFGEGAVNIMNAADRREAAAELLIPSGNLARGEPK